MKFVNEYLAIRENMNRETVEALETANKNPVLVRRIVTLFVECNFRLKPLENPYAEDTKRLGITATTARILNKYYKFADRREAEELQKRKTLYWQYAGTVPLCDRRNIA